MGVGKPVGWQGFSKSGGLWAGAEAAISGGTLTLAQLLGFLGSLFFLGQALTAMLVYVWSRRSPQVRVNFFGLLTFQAPFLPWALMGFSMLLGNSILVDLLGEPACPASQPIPSWLLCHRPPSHLHWTPHSCAPTPTLPLCSYSPLHKPAGLQASHLQASPAEAFVGPDQGGDGKVIVPAMAPAPLRFSGPPLPRSWVL